MQTMKILYRTAQLEDIPALEELIPISARVLQSGYYSTEQLDAAIGTIFGVDSQLIRDGTYLIASVDGRIVGCGGWSQRKALYGGDRLKKAEDPLRDPLHDPAMIRAFFVHPDMARKGIGRELLRLSEVGAAQAGFASIEIVATLAGEPLYLACGYVTVERYSIECAEGLALPVVRMKKAAVSV